MNTTGQDVKVKIGSIKKIKSEVNLEIKHLWNQTVTSEASLNTNKQEMEETISPTVTIDKKMDTLVK